MKPSKTTIAGWCNYSAHEVKVLLCDGTPLFRDAGVLCSLKTRRLCEKNKSCSQKDYIDEFLKQAFRRCRKVVITIAKRM